jgi:hypothetical protein
MSDLPTTSDDAGRGGMGVVLLVFCVLGFALSIAAEAVYLRFAETAANGASLRITRFDTTPVGNLVQPKPNFSPDKVVEIQLAGLTNPDFSQGIQQCFAFASPNNRQATGPLPRFAAMVCRSPYAVLMHHHLVLVGSPIIEGENASVVVTLLDEAGGIHVFQFLLSKQHGETVENCWMTEAVYPLEQVPGEQVAHPETASAPHLKKQAADATSDLNRSAHA